jgi:hypothetical protein
VTETVPPVNEVCVQFDSAPENVRAPGIQSGICHRDPDAEVVPRVIVFHCDDVEYAPRSVLVLVDLCPKVGHECLNPVGFPPEPAHIPSTNYSATWRR